MSRSACSRRAASRPLGTQTSGPSALLGLYPSLRSIRAAHDGCALPGTGGKVSGVGTPRPVVRLCTWLGQVQYINTASGGIDHAGRPRPPESCICAPRDRHTAPQGLFAPWSLLRNRFIIPQVFPLYKGFLLPHTRKRGFSFPGKGVFPPSREAFYQDAFFTPGIWPL